MEDFVAHVNRLLVARHWSQARLIQEAASYDAPGTATDTIRSAVRGKRTPSAAVVKAVARALDVPPAEFPEYRVARARERLDPAVVGMASALASADILLSQPIPEDVAEEAAQQREDTTPATSPAAPIRHRKGPAG